MSIARSVVAVIVGYVIFAASAFAFFKFTGQPPHRAAPLPIMLGSIVTGVVFAFLGGYLAARIAVRRPLAHGMAVASVLALGAVVSLVGTLDHGAIWSQMAALVLMAPSAGIGGWVRSKQLAARSHVA